MTESRWALACAPRRLQMLRGEQLARICAALCRAAGLGGPGARMEELLALARSGKLSDGEWVLVGIAFDLWNRSGSIFFRDLIRVLDAQQLGMVGTLLAAMAAAEQDKGERVEAWLVEREGAGTEAAGGTAPAESHGERRTGEFVG